jgi:hypothetical protein
VKKNRGGFHNGLDAEVFGSQCFATPQATIVKKMCDTPSTFHNALSDAPLPIWHPQSGVRGDS